MSHGCSDKLQRSRRLEGLRGGPNQRQVAPGGTGKAWSVQEWPIPTQPSSSLSQSTGQVLPEAEELPL